MQIHSLNQREYYQEGLVFSIFLNDGAQNKKNFYQLFLVSFTAGSHKASESL